MFCVLPFRWHEEDEDDLRLRHYYQHQLRSLFDAVDSSGPIASPYVGHDEVRAQIRLEAWHVMEYDPFYVTSTSILDEWGNEQQQ